MAAFLFGLALSLDVYFAGVERAVNRELERVGPGRVVLTHFTFGESLLELDGAIDSRLDPLRRYGHLAYLRRVPQRAEVELVGEAVILGYRDRDLRALRHFFPGIDRAAAFILTDRSAIPEGTRLRLTIDTIDLAATVVDVPSGWLEGLSSQSALLLPGAWTSGLERTGFVEILLFESRASEVPAIGAQIERLRQWLRLDRFSGVSIRSGLEVLERLESLREQQALWSLLVRSVVAGLVVLVFASSAFLEYRENAYLSALLQSMGVPKLFLFLRYAVEHGLLLLAGFGIAASAIDFWLPRIAALEGVTAGAAGELFSITESLANWWPVLLATAAFSLVPIVLGLRREIGKTLQ